MHEPHDLNAPKDPRPLAGSLTTGEAARHLSVSPNTIKRWIAAGALRAYTTPGGHWRIPFESFARFLTERGLPPIEFLEPAGARER